MGCQELSSSSAGGAAEPGGCPEARYPIPALPGEEKGPRVPGALGGDVGAEKIPGFLHACGKTHNRHLISVISPHGVSGIHTGKKNPTGRGSGRGKNSFPNRIFPSYLFSCHHLTPFISLYIYCPLHSVFSLIKRAL